MGGTPYLSAAAMAAYNKIERAAQMAHMGACQRVRLKARSGAVGAVIQAEIDHDQQQLDPGSAVEEEGPLRGPYGGNP